MMKEDSKELRENNKRFPSKYLKGRERKNRADKLIRDVMLM